MNRIIGFNFTEISAQRKKPQEGKIEINVNIDIESITSEKIDLVKDPDQEALKFDFKFTVSYKPELANIVLRGTVLSMINKEKSKEIIKKWKSKKIEEDTKIPLFNFILTKCNLRALQLEEELNLPTHVPLPRIQPEKSDTAYTG